MELGLMDNLHLLGVDIILWLQDLLKGHEELMLFLSHVGDPRNAFLIYFPLAYFSHAVTGIKVMWTGIISEWLNAIFKWILFGHRPYWWVHVCGIYGDNMPHLEQYRLTCETGPGSPSGHAMVTSSVMYMLVRCLTKYSPAVATRSFLKVSLWTLFALVMILISISRCFIATHFPHQVVAGVITGSIIGELVFHSNTYFPLKGYIGFSLFILLTGPATYWLIQTLGYDPMWTVALSQKWCARPEWVYLDTTLFYAFIRDASVLLGTGLGLWKVRGLQTDKSLSWRVVLQIMVSVLFTRGMEHVKISHRDPVFFYSFAFIKYVLVFLTVVTFVRKFCDLLLPGNYPEQKNR